MLVLKHCNIGYSEPLIRDVSCTLETGMIYGLSARNGMGKTTFLRYLSGLLPTISGCKEVIEDGEVKTKQEEKKRIFYFESTEWFDGNLSALDYFGYYSSLLSSENNMMNQADAIRFWEIEQYVTLPIHKCSLGTKQKFLLCLYGLSGGKYWLLDEPTIGLDSNSLEKFQEFLLLSKSENNSILFSSHQNDDLYALCDSIFLLENQSLVIEGEMR